jgi:FAD synthetase
MKKVLVFGTFDVLHPGHIYFLKQARAKGDYLIASVARDSFVERAKDKKPAQSENLRRSLLVKSGLVDEAHLSDEQPGTYSIVSHAESAIICFGHDQMDLRENLLAWLEKNGKTVETCILAAYKPHKYKTSKIITASTD